MEKMDYKQFDTVDGRTLLVFMYGMGSQEFEVPFDVTDFRSGNVMINATKMVKLFPGKTIGHFMANDSTKEYIQALEHVTGIPTSLLIRVEKGNYADERQQGTWMHRNLAIKFAKWLDPYFGIWCNNINLFIISEGLFGGVSGTGKTGYYGNDPNYVMVDDKDILVERYVDSESNINLPIPIDVTNFENNHLRVYVTDLVKMYPNKRINDFLSGKSTGRLIRALMDVTGLPQDKICSVVQGGDPRMQGTWMHQLLAMELAQWLDPYFGVWCSEKILEVIEKGMATVYPKEFQRYYNTINTITAENLALRNKLDSYQSMVDFCNLCLTSSDNLYTSTEMVRILNTQGRIPSAAALHKYLIDHGFAFKVKGGIALKLPYSKLNLTKSVVDIINNPNGGNSVYRRNKWTENGMYFLKMILL